jgi:hypothetical protein
MSLLLARSFFEQKPISNPEQSYLVGVRGLLVIESFLWTFLQTFLPAAVKDSEVNGPLYQTILRKTLSVIFWNETLLYSSFILLSARTICVPFISNPTSQTLASAAFRRGLRLWFPVAFSLAISKIVFSSLGYGYIANFIKNTPNPAIITPYDMPNTLVYFNSVFNLFWVTRNFYSQAGSLAFPSATLWIVNVIYTQSYTVFMTMVIIPYTRKSWRVKSLCLFIVTAWWVQSWAWYSITGMLIADLVMTMDFKGASARGIPVTVPFVNRTYRIPGWIPSGLLMLVGTMMMYLWTAWKPEEVNAELIAHTGLYYTGGLNDEWVINQPQARDDNYIFLVGFFLLLESSNFLQWAFSNPLFTYLGRRSLSELYDQY